MAPEITLIAGTSTDWTKFVTLANERLGRSPTRQLDECGLPVGSPATFVAALGEFANPGCNPLTVLKDAQRLLEHLSFTFMIACDHDTLVAVLKQATGLSVLMAEPSRHRENFVITGTLRAWKALIVEGCNSTAQDEMRLFFNEMWKTFDRLGFKEMFAGYRRKELRDRTFALESSR